MPHFNNAALLAWRLDSGKSQEEVAYRAGISYMYVRQLENGRSSNPSTAVLLRLAAVFGRPVGELFTDEPARRPSRARAS